MTVISGAAAAQVAGNSWADASITSARVEGPDTLVLTEFPYYIPKQVVISFETKIDGRFTYVNVGKAHEYIKVDSTNIMLYGNLKDGSFGLREVIPHGLTVRDRLSVTVHVIGEETTMDTMNARIWLSTDGGSFSTTTDSWWYAGSGNVFADFDFNGSEATLSACCPDFACPIWMMGDSYFGLSAVRWPYYMRQMGYFNFHLEGLSGGTSWDMYNELVKALKYGTPTYLVWCLGMNNPDTDSITPNTSWVNHLEKVKTLCAEKGITLILSTTPNVPTRINTAKNDVVKSSGYRYIDFARAVGGEETGSSWLDGMLYKDGIHPSTTGAQALANQVLEDFPEMKYLARDAASGDVDGNCVIDITDVNIETNIVLNKDHALRYGGRADVNGDGDVDVSDVNAAINILLTPDEGTTHQVNCPPGKGEHGAL